MFQESLNVVLRKFQGFFEGDYRVFEGCFNGVLRMFQALQGNYTDISRKLQRRLKGDLTEF